MHRCKQRGVVPINTDGVADMTGLACIQHHMHQAGVLVAPHCNCNLYMNGSSMPGGMSIRHWDGIPRLCAAQVYDKSQKSKCCNDFFVAHDASWKSPEWRQSRPQACRPHLPGNEGSAPRRSGPVMRDQQHGHKHLPHYNASGWEVC